MESTELLVIGAGPYGLSAAACAQDRGIEATLLGRPMGFWREHMPAEMLLRSDSSWHLDAAGIDTFEGFLESRGLRPADVDPIPQRLVLEYSDWFMARKKLAPRADLVEALTHEDGRFVATLESGARIAADKVLATPGFRHFATVPEWAKTLPPERASHTFDTVSFDHLAGRRVLIIGGRQSAYEWAALIGEAGAERIDIVHRHDMPAFGRVDWKFADDVIDKTMATRGWWKKLTQPERDAVTYQFWSAGRLTLEYWLVPRLDKPFIHRWPNAEVVEARAGADGVIAVTLSNGERLAVDHVIFASGYKPNLARVPWLRGVLDRLATAEGFPVLGDSFETSLPGLYMSGLISTRDFAVIFGFMRGAAPSASMIVEDMLASV